MPSSSIHLSTITKIDKEPYLLEIYENVNRLVEELHPELFKSVESKAGYNIITENITDAYKNLTHIMLLKKIPGMKIPYIVNSHSLLKSISDEFELGYDYAKINEIEENLQKIFEKHCVKTNKETIFK